MADYEPLWQAQLAGAQSGLLALAALRPGEAVLDVASGTGLVSFEAARSVGPQGRVLGVDLSAKMVDAAQARCARHGLHQVRFERMDAEHLELPDGGFDAVLCALGLMYVPDPEQAVREMRRVLRPGGRLVVAVWGGRARCAWASVFPIVDAEVSSEVCPQFFRLGIGDNLARACADAGFETVRHERLPALLDYADAHTACDAAFVGGPVALAWSRFDDATRARVRARYLETLAPWREGQRYRLPAEFVLASASVPQT